MIETGIVKLHETRKSAAPADAVLSIVFPLLRYCYDRAGSLVWMIRYVGIAHRPKPPAYPIGARTPVGFAVAGVFIAPFQV